MSKWLIIGLLAFLALGLGLWISVDPNARQEAAQVWNNIDGDSLLGPIAQAFKDFADSVGRLWSPDAIKIDIPSVGLPH